jgi:hypothetical protein
MRAILLFLPLCFLSCAPTISQREVLGRARAEVAARETWSDSALIRVTNTPSFLWSKWEIEAGRIDDSSFPVYEGLDMVPGTERELKFARNGCLVSYNHNPSGCSNRYRTVVPSPAPDK